MKKLLPFLLVVLFLACTFEYGDGEDSEREMPDLIMENVVYIRVRSSDPIARFQAERAERFENIGLMKLQNFSFEQYGEKGAEANTFGSAGFASIDIESGDVFMENSVRLEIETENIVLETDQLDWKEEDRILTTRPDDEVRIFQDTGTSFTGIGLRVDARRQAWEFFGIVTGTYVSEEDESEEITDSEETETREFEQVPVIIDQIDEEELPEIREPVTEEKEQIIGEEGEVLSIDELK